MNIQHQISNLLKALQADPSNPDQLSNRELLLEMVGKIRGLETRQENQQGTLQVLSMATQGLLNGSTAQLSQLTALRAHQITHAVPQVVMGSSGSLMPSAQASSNQPASKAVQRSLKRTQLWQSRNLRRQHEQQTMQAEGQQPSTAAETHRISSTCPTGTVPTASAAAPNPTAGHSAAAGGPAGASNAGAGPSVSANLTHLQPQPPRVAGGPSLAPGVHIPGTDIAPWQDLKWAAFNTIGGEPDDYQLISPQVVAFLIARSRGPYAPYHQSPESQAIC